MKNYDCHPFSHLYETGVGTKHVIEPALIQKKLMNSTQCCYMTMKSMKLGT